MHSKYNYANIGDGAVYFGWIGVLIAAITIASNGFMHNKLEDLGPFYCNDASSASLWLLCPFDYKPSVVY